ncbi:hypothetical protein [Foetidibacter luteolus]|uniref:hypothetical protein n=1 Tax=Foetidibacter luteolus TaxID=2608880 RepID=UPI00129A562F|nr:hypothetical protein [Foetidibacter luteolus]
MELVSNAPTPFKPFAVPYVFTCEINGKQLKVTVSGEYDLVCNFAYQVNFSDGFEGMFVECEGYWWVEKRKGGKEYAEAVKTQLHDLISKRIEENRRLRQSN